METIVITKEVADKLYSKMDSKEYHYVETFVYTGTTEYVDFDVFFELNGKMYVLKGDWDTDFGHHAFFNADDLFNAEDTIVCARLDETEEQYYLELKALKRKYFKI